MGSARPGLALAAVSAACFSTSGTFGSSLITAGWSPGAAVLARVAIAALILTVPALLQLRGHQVAIRRGFGQAVAFGLVAVAGCQFFYFNALARIPVGVALLIEYLGAVMVVAWLWLRHGQRPRRLTVAGAVVAITGLALVLDLAGTGRLDPIGVMWALLGAVGLAVFFLLSASRPEESLPPLAMTWIGMCTGAVVLASAGLAGMLPLHARLGTVNLLRHQVSWIVPVLGLSLVAGVIAYLAGISATRRLGAKLASFIGMSEILFATLFAWLLLSQTPTGTQFIGGAFILAGITLVRLDELRGPAPDRSPGRAPTGSDPQVLAGIGQEQR